MNKLEQLKKAFGERANEDLPRLAHHSWCTLEMVKPKGVITIDMLDDLYCGLVSGVMCNLGSGKVPEIMEGIGPNAEDRHSVKSYQMLFDELVHFSNSLSSLEDWVIKNPESEQWVEFIEGAFKIEEEYKKDPEAWLVSYRKMLSENFVFKPFDLN